MASVVEQCRRLLRGNLSPKLYHRVRFAVWTSRVYVPRLVASTVVRQNPKIQQFPAGHSSETFSRLKHVNVFAPTELCRVMTRNGSDKGHHTWHNYTTIYSSLLDQPRDLPLRIFELGLGTFNPQYAANMGQDGRPGASLRGWREIFPKSQIFGADIDKEVLFEEHRIKTFYCDQLDKQAIAQLWAQPEMEGGMDLIIDDGLHTFAGNVSFLENSIQFLRPGGTYIVEDILKSALPQWRSELETVYAPRFPDHEFAIIELPNADNDYDNNLAVIRKPLAI